MLRLAITISILFLFLFHTEAQLYTFKQFNHKSGLANSSIRSIAEDKEGYIWFGTDGSGLVKFDGSSFRTFEQYDVGNQHHVNSISVGENNELYFSSEYNGYLKHDNKKSTVFFNTELEEGSKEAIINFKDRKVVFTTNSIKIINKDLIVSNYTIYPNAEKLDVLQTVFLNETLICFTSRGNYVFKNDAIIPLHDWLGTSKSLTEDYIHGYKTGDSLIIVDKKLRFETTILMRGDTPGFFITDSLRSDVELGANEQITFSTTRFNTSALVTNKGRILKRKDRFKEIVINGKFKISDPTDIIIDNNNDTWITTRKTGAYRISLEPFTKINLHPVYKNTHIGFIAKFKNGTVVLSTMEGVSYIGNMDSNKAFKKSNHNFQSLITFNKKKYLSSFDGIYQIDNKGNLTPVFPFFKGKSCIVLEGTDNFFWVNVKNKGIYKVFKNGKYEYQKENLPNYFYTSQKIGDFQYFGTNRGIFVFNHKKAIWTNNITGYTVSESGPYVGVSTKDNKGNIYFTGDFGITRISAKKEVSLIKDNTFFPSKLFYTLNCDKDGNLIIGTNKGINFLRLDNEGIPISSKIYNAKNGFGGFETHMRVQFQDDFDNIFVGTLEGLFLIKPKLFEKKIKPRTPKITTVKNKLSDRNLINKENPRFEKDKNNLLIKFKLINSKDLNVKYTYLLEGYEDKWSAFSRNEKVVFSNLPEGDFTFKVKAAYDNNITSNIASYSFSISSPFYKKKAFIITLILLLIVTNILILVKTRNYNSDNIILTRDIELKSKISSVILIFGGIANTAAHIVAPIVDETLPILIWPNVIIGILLCTFGILIKTNTDFRKNAKGLLLLGFIIIIGYNIYGTFISAIHPFYLCVIILVLMLTPYVINRIRHILVFGIIMVLIGLSVIVFTEEAVFNKTLYLIAVSIASCIAFFSTYLRNSSLENLIFTSGVVNKGNVLVIAFNRNSNISYMSENFEELFDLEINNLIGKPISSLNALKPEKGTNNFDEINLHKEFEDDKVFTVPLIIKENQVKYYQWSCKEFSKNVRVIIGQDITEKINIERYYELLVQNADDLIYQTDVDGNFVYLNEKCEEVTKYKAKELIGKETMSIVHQDHLAETMKFYATQFKSETKTTYFEFPIVTKDGEKRWLGQNVSTIIKEGTDNIVEGYLSLARDITDRKKSDAIIKEQNKDITASINYAKRIQYNLLPSKSKFEEKFNECFVFYKPKDIVSGDFYWLDTIEGDTVLVTADCTGHGVPGSFMTLLGINLLNQIILEDRITDPAHILNALDERLIEILPRDGAEKINDGMECSVCVFQKRSKTVKYATAGSKIIHIKNRELIYLRGDKKHIGDTNPDFEGFTNKTLTLESEDTLYTFSDGFQDQFGGLKDKKLMPKRFKKMLSELEEITFDKRMDYIEDTLISWQGDIHQTDDITIIGIQAVE